LDGVGADVSVADVVIHDDGGTGVAAIVDVAITAALSAGIGLASCASCEGRT
jgi:hypothetical protein